jgi:hypothetical protein
MKIGPDFFGKMVIFNMNQALVRKLIFLVGFLEAVPLLEKIFFKS